MLGRNDELNATVTITYFPGVKLIFKSQLFKSSASLWSLAGTLPTDLLNIDFNGL